MRVGIALLAVFGCVRSSAMECDTGRVCATGTRCDEVHQLCVTEDQATACADLLDGDQCTAGALLGICDRGYCIQGCGNGVVENLAQLSLGEAEECDDGNFRNHDGCSSSCKLEQLSWTEWHDTWIERLGHASAYDAARHRLVVFGGELATGPSNDHWEHANGPLDLGWSQVEPHDAWPSPRFDAMMVYDSARQVIVLFGGIDSIGATLSDTWEYDGQGWQLRSPTTSPPKRRAGAMAFDPVDNKVVLFGGLDSSGNRGDTWLYDGTTWTEVTVSGPSARRYPTMTWDAARQGVVMFGGLSSTGLPADTWVYAAGAWTNLSITGPVGRYAGQLAYSSAIQRTVLFGGVTPLGFASDTWELGSTGWLQANPAPIEPAARGFGTAVANPDTGTIVLVAGRNGEALDDIWEYSATRTWKPFVPQLSPPFRENGRMVYDTTRDEAIVFAGLAGGTLADTWTFDGTQWSLASLNAPGVYGPAVAYDPLRDRVVEFGGTAAGGQSNGLTNEWDPATQTWRFSVVAARPPHAFGAMSFDPHTNTLVQFGGFSGGPSNATLEYDGAAWNEIASTTRPTADGVPTMTYDPVGGRMVLFTAGETWQRIDREWSRLELSSSPGPRPAAVMVFHPERGRIWLYGGHLGNTIYSEIWELGDQGWTEVPVVGEGPPPRRWPALVGLPRERQLMLFGGTGTYSVLGDTWFLRYQSGTPDEDCVNGIDDDGDRRADIRDPDCVP